MTATLAPLPAGTDDVVMRKLFPEPDPFLTDPVGWVENQGGFLWSMQRKVAESVAANRYTCVPSAHDTGKSFSAAQFVAWWLDVHPAGEAFAVTTAPTTAQVEAILWREISRAQKRASLPGRITLDAKWYMPVDGGDELVAYGRKPADYDQAAFQGIHARYVLIVIDEACGVPKNLFDAVDSLATNTNARVLAIGNPDDPATHFADIAAPGSGWNTIHISVFDTPNFTGERVPDYLPELLVGQEWVEERKRRWGETSPLYVSKVLGQFPDVSDDTLISPKLIREAQQRELPGMARGQFGADIADQGADETTLYRNRGGVIRFVYRAHKDTPMATAGKIKRHLDETPGVPVQVDSIGVGSGVLDRLVEQALPAHPFNAANSAYDPIHYKNRRAEAWWGMRTLFEEGLIDLDPDDDELAAQLGSIKYKVDSAGRIQIESKEEMKKRGLPSPDRADGAMMSCVPVPSTPTPDPDVDQEAGDLTSDLLERAM